MQNLRNKHVLCGTEILTADVTGKMETATVLEYSSDEEACILIQMERLERQAVILKSKAWM